MKKLVVTALMVLSCGVATALPVGNPSDASLYRNGFWTGSSCAEPCDPCFSWCDAFTLRFGFYGDYVFNRHLQLENATSPYENIYQTELFTSAGLLVLNVCNWVDVFATLGASNIGIFTDGGSFGAAAGVLDTTMVGIQFKPDFSWSVGGRATLWECGCFGVGLEGQYFRTTPDLDSIIQYRTGDIVYFNDANNNAIYQEWQVGLGASYRWTTGCPGLSFIPYIAVKWANGKLDASNDVLVAAGTTYTLPTFEPQRNWGYAIGMTALLCDVIGVTVEGRWADEKAVHVNGQIRF